MIEEGEVGRFGLLMTPSLSKDIRGVTYDHTILNSIVQRAKGSL